jgi:hypothetical protein
MQCIFVALSRPKLKVLPFDQTRTRITLCVTRMSNQVESADARCVLVRGFERRKRYSTRSGRPLRVKRNRNLENDRSPQSPSRRRSANFIHRHKQHMSAASWSRVISSQGLLRNDGDARSDFATILAPRCSPNRNDDIWRWLTCNAPAPSVHNDGRRDQEL